MKHRSASKQCPVQQGSAMTPSHSVHNFCRSSAVRQHQPSPYSSTHLYALTLTAILFLHVLSLSSDPPNIYINNHCHPVLKQSLTWLRAEPHITTEGRTDNGGTGSTVMISHSGRENFGSMPRTKQSPSEMLRNTSKTRSAMTTIFFSWFSSLVCVQTAVMSRPFFLNFGWK